MDLAEYFPGGGTFSAALDAALECLRHAKYKKSDIAFIMNGESQVSAECAEKFRRKKAKFGFSLLLNSDRRGPSSLGTLKEFRRPHHHHQTTDG